MKKSLISRLAVVGICIALVATTALAAMNVSAQSAQPGQEHVLCSGLPGTVGLAMDKRGNLYTAERQTGHIFCVPPTSDPILLAKVPGTPTALTVDKLRNVFVSTMEGTVYLVALDGTVETAYQCQSKLVGLNIDRDGGLVIATEEGQIIKVKRKDLLLGQ
ncbi:MAG: hypothetical protein OCC46_04125 [Pseudodesulfovibrio sp.]